jgi:hypothetical protein
VNAWLVRGIRWTSPIFLYCGLLFSLNVAAYRDQDAALAVAFMLLPASLWAGVMVVLSDDGHRFRHPKFYVGCYLTAAIAFVGSAAHRLIG